MSEIGQSMPPRAASFPQGRLLPVGLDDVLAARARLATVAVRSPLIHVPALEAEAGGPVLIKFEGAQREGSFKFRGAFNRLSQLDADGRARGVVAWSSGNHAQGVAAAARQLGMAATIVMPADAPRVKLDNTRALGAQIILYDRHRESREQIARDVAAATGATIVPSYDDPDIIAGQGTIGLEILEQAGSLGLDIDQILVPCGGGGLIAGIATATKELQPGIELYSVEPAGFDDTARSLRAGRRLRNRPEARSICDALLAPEPGALTFKINRRLLSGGLVVSEPEVCDAMRYAFARLKLVTEPGGAVALAALLHNKAPAASATVVVISGSNVDPGLFREVVLS